MMWGTRAMSLALSCLLIVPGLAAEHVVLESNSPAYTPGQTFDSSSPVMLAERQFIVIATDDGRLIRVEGPHAGPAEGAAPPENTVRELLGRLLGGSRNELGGLAGVRGGEDISAATTPTATLRSPTWSIDATQTGEQCYLSGRPLELWRDPATTAARAEITDVASGNTASVAWERSAALTPWPTAIAPADAGIYLIRADDSIRSVAVRLHALQPSAVERDLVAVAWLAAKACLAQARGLMSRSRPSATD